MTDDEKKLSTLKRLQTPMGAEQVRELQEQWNKLYPEDQLVVDGVFGPQTKDRVSKLLVALMAAKS